jgi:hypothetical protein
MHEKRHVTQPAVAIDRAQGCRLGHTDSGHSTNAGQCCMSSGTNAPPDDE